MRSWLAKRLASFLYEVVNEIAKMEKDDDLPEGGPAITLGMADEIQARPFGFHNNVIS